MIVWQILSQVEGIWEEDELIPLDGQSLDDFLFRILLNMDSNMTNSRKVDVEKSNIITKENQLSTRINELKLRPPCPKKKTIVDPIFEIIRECWLETGLFRPDARQIYYKINNAESSILNST